MEPSVQEPARPSIDFDRALRRGARMYDGPVGRWWAGQAQDAAHRRAYREIARWVPHVAPAAGVRITDYACGAGDLLVVLREAFPEALLRGIDSSARMVEQARARLHAAPRPPRAVRLVRTPLPDFDLPRATEHAVLFVFPNLAGVDASALGPAERAAARRLAREKDEEADPGDPPEDPKEAYSAMCAERTVALNARHLLKRGGSFIKVEYGDCEIEEMTSLSKRRSAFEAASREGDLADRALPQPFERVKTRYFPSRVIEDVYHQTGAEDDLHGGFVITRYKAC